MGDGLGMLRSPLRSSKPHFDEARLTVPNRAASQNARPPGRWRFLEFSWSPPAQEIAPEPAQDHGWAAFFCAFPKAHKRLDGKLNVATKNKGAGGIGTVSTPGAMQSHGQVLPPPHLQMAYAIPPITIPPPPNWGRVGWGKRAMIVSHRNAASPSLTSPQSWGRGFFSEPPPKRAGRPLVRAPAAA